VPLLTKVRIDALWGVCLSNTLLTSNQAAQRPLQHCLGLDFRLNEGLPAMDNRYASLGRSRLYGHPRAVQTGFYRVA
jgi:hypothetical protein